MLGRWFSCFSWTFPVLCVVVVLSISFARADDDKTGYSVDSNLVKEETSTSAPKIKLRIGKDWENITGKVGAPPTGIYTVYSRKGDDFFLSCTASYPIQWNISGMIAPPEVVKFQEPSRDIKKNVFHIQINIFFLDAENFTDLAASASIACHEVKHPENRDEVAVFVKGNSGRSLSTPVNTVLEGEVTVIPCFTTDSTSSSKTALYFRAHSDQSEKLVEDVIYHPSQGFRYASQEIKLFAGGIYKCRKNGQSVTITVADSLSPSSADNQFAPISSIVRRFADETILFKCSSKIKPVRLIFDHSNDTIATVITDLEKNKVVKLARDATTLTSSKSPRLQGKAACIAEADDLIKEWSWEFIELPVLHLDNLEGEADCLSPLTPKIVQTVRCTNGMDCDFMGNSCLGNKTLCNFKKQKQFFADTDTYCWIDKLQKGLPCVSVPFSHLNGLVKCDVMGLSRQWEFFISLDYMRCSNWKDAPLKELVRISEISDDDHNDITKFVCTASAYLFTESLAFEILYKNGSSSIIQQTEQINSSPQRKRPRQIMELYVKATLDKKMISQDAVSIDCLARFWNSTDVLRASKLLRKGRKRMSALSSKIENPKLLEQSEIERSDPTFYIGEKNARLNCSNLAELEIATWLYKETETTGGSFKKALKVFPELIAGYINETEENYLEFPKVEKKHGGSYECVILSEEENNNDELSINGDSSRMVLRKYKLQVSAEPLPTSTTVYIGLTIMILIVVGLAIAAFAVFVQKRNT